uniref:TLC domain-containing protein n=1 Tax=Strigamia maritima TaxID=126957 RepID=T1J2L9_STRMM
MLVIGVLLALMGFIFYGGLFVWFRRFYSKSLTPPYSAHDLLDICNKSVSASHAVLSSLAGIAITTNIGDDIKFETVWVTNTFAWFGFPYFMYDLWCMFHVYRHHGMNEGLSLSKQLNTFVAANPVMIIHHIVLFFVAFPLTVHYRKNMGDYFVGCFYLAELSTPFVSIRAIMSKRGMKNSLLYVINGVVMMVSFFVCRVCVFPYLYYTYSIYAKIPISKVR